MATNKIGEKVKMHKTFWDNPYQQSLHTIVESISGDEVLFKETIIYSFSGGQESDSATVNDIPVIGSRMDGAEIYYSLAPGHNLSIGSKVEMQINWPRRNKLMRLHFACELILVLLNRSFADKKIGEELLPEEIDHVGIEKTGAHIAEDKARIDFKLEQNIANFFPAILSEYNQVIADNLAIETGFIDEHTQQRYWRIAGLATVPCGGTHVKFTAEVGEVALKRDRPGKGIERIKITLV